MKNLALVSDRYQFPPHEKRIRLFF